MTEKERMLANLRSALDVEIPYLEELKRKAQEDVANREHWERMTDLCFERIRNFKRLIKQAGE